MGNSLHKYRDQINKEFAWLFTSGILYWENDNLIGICPTGLEVAIGHATEKGTLLYLQNNPSPEDW